MGAWSHDAFGNDSACDWAYELEQVDDLSVIEATLAAAPDAPDADLDAGLATEALAAVEVVARLRGHAGYCNAYTERVDEWVARTRLLPSVGLVERALAVLDRVIGSESDLRAAWDEAGAGNAWMASVAELRQRLLAAPIALAPAAPPLDAVSKLIRRLSQLDFEMPALPPEATVNALYRDVVAAEALGDVIRLRDSLARVWQPVAQLGKDSVLWDLAVREAKIWAGQGRLDDALAGLEAWRWTVSTLGPGDHEMRCVSLCLAARDLARARQMQDQAAALNPKPEMIYLDQALLEARLGSVETAQALLEAHAAAFSAEPLQAIVGFIRGILATRAGDAQALGLLSAAAENWISKAETSPAAWSMLSIFAGWWALALQQSGREADAGGLLVAVRPILLQAHNLELIEVLTQQGLLDPGLPIQGLPVLAGAAVADMGGTLADHSAFRTETVRGVQALRRLEVLRREFAQGSGVYPFLIGDADDLAGLLGAIEPPAGPTLTAALEEARAFKLSDWLAPQARKAKPRWPKQAAPAATQLQSLYETTSGRLKPALTIGLVRLGHPSELFVRLGWGDWNGCPAPALHAALHRHWGDAFGAEPVALSADVVECMVSRPPESQAQALALAVEQAAYCSDIVEQGVGSVGQLAATVLKAPVWYFWWD